MITHKEMNEMLDLYVLLNEEQKAKIFTAEQIKVLNTADFYRRLFNNKQFYNAVEKAVGEAVYETLRTEA